MRIVVIGGWAPSLLNFRGPLLAEMVRRGHEVIAVAPEPAPTIENELNALGVQYRSVPFSRAKINPVADLFLIQRLRGLFRELRPDIVLAYTAKPVIYGLLAARLAGIRRYAAMVTGLGYAFGGAAKSRGVLEGVLKGLYRLSLARAEVVYFQNPDDMRLFTELGLTTRGQSELVNGSGVDVNHYEQAPLPESDSVVFLLAARLLIAKGVLEYIAAARELKNSAVNVEFRLLGYFDEDGNPEAILQSQVKGWEQEGVITFLGRADDVRPHLAAADVFVLPSYREGTPRTVLEAMSTGRAIVTSDAPGCRETVIEGHNGFLVPVRDAPALAATLRRFVDKPKLIESMGQASRRLAIEKYDVRKVNQAILARLGI